MPHNKYKNIFLHYAAHTYVYLHFTLTLIIIIVVTMMIIAVALYWKDLSNDLAIYLNALYRLL